MSKVILMLALLLPLQFALADIPGARCYPRSDGGCRVCWQDEGACHYYSVSCGGFGCGSQQTRKSTKSISDVIDGAIIIVPTATKSSPVSDAPVYRPMPQPEPEQTCPITSMVYDENQGWHCVNQCLQDHFDPELGWVCDQMAY